MIPIKRLRRRVWGNARTKIDSLGDTICSDRRADAKPIDFLLGIQSIEERFFSSPVCPSPSLCVLPVIYCHSELLKVPDAIRPSPSISGVQSTHSISLQPPVPEPSRK